MGKNNFLTTIIILLVFLLSITITVSAFQVKLNDRGRDVMEIQKYLKTLGYNAAPDGIFGRSTENAIKDFQRSQNLSVDGIAGDNTRQLLKKMISEKVSYELYLVDNGDTLSGIARSKDSSVKEIMEFNNLSSVKIKPGQDLKIPRDKIIKTVSNNKSTAGSAASKAENAQVYYTVRRGDTLSSIAARRNLPVEEIMNANNLNSDFIKAGQELVLPIIDSKAVKNNSSAKIKEANSSSKQIVHQVQRGDALSSIARLYGTNVDAIRRANNLSGDRIFAGDKLIITDYQRGPVSLERGSLIWPVNGRITSNFGWRVHPIKKTRLFHNGLDIAVPSGTRVKAAAGGKVVHSGWMNGFGYTVIIDHGRGIETLYAHNSKVSVAKGSMVNKGQVVALSGNTGLSTGPHLHFGVLQNEKPLNPKNYLP
ncbi:LysM peptidoglycan-binding domain-containing protein [Halanaerobium congolense]|jgi:murein DD-endopeptidase MepM/ murein hydrolase activator NlpD|uniref:Murein DD-endopeptidase MepM/ murein hydrolase activator NlpD n=1 Tax=Halanaerobium congolense TaxID=54121 RepID=A0A1G9P116_9FIRM|nr:LysM peptidoglycan-binding domain-containing protein [Halanaerobium congolense]PXV69889.1 murein DD-endopeptidase MepM/ murein hydrolase activator NlpD [Halanaerobium congolense]TDX48097.1 murein DD-endopeptidase MepM/ murein hydrolase activator NlpD [Halanaerobium congolense]SDH31436.1 Murein DD-endopeptidase MepM and murein hydrolase activator NlpD, contain LysM domain [Halanaerobium congolense]SDK32838.1 Murein DD-endopeptidase MepM and murein hydrolase activator NlpD, contain LysM domain